MDIYKTLLLFALVCALAAFFVMWAKWEEEKVKTREERENYQAALRIGKTNAEYAQRLEKELEQSKAREKCSAQSVLWYAESLKREKEILVSWKHEYEWLWNEKGKMQDRLSALLCPTNNHVWKDGICTKCGRVKDG